MQKISHNKKIGKKAFSLLELSVVVVIVGVLISGVTAGSSLLKGSRLASAQSITLSSQIVTIPGLVLWVENSVKESFATSQITDGKQVTTWYNREPSGYLVKNNLTAAASADVLYEETGINNLPSLKMTVAGSMSLANFSGSTLSASTIVIVFRPNAATSSTATTIIDASPSASATYSIGIKNDRAVLNAGTNVETSTVTNPISFAINTPYILMVYFNGASSKVFSNNINEAGGSGAVLNAGTNALDGLTVGENRSNASGIAAEISEVMVFNRVLKDTERADVMSYLSKKYKITVTGV